MQVSICVLVPFLSFCSHPAPQEQELNKLEHLVSQLDHESIEVREEAQKKLEGLGPTAIPAVRRILSDPTSPEVQQRLKSILGSLLRRESESLYQEGKLEQALIQLAESQGEKDPAAYVARRTQEATTFVRAFIPEDISPFSAEAEAGREAGKKIRELHGRWALPELLRLLNLDRPDFQGTTRVFYMFIGMGSDVIPPLSHGLKGKQRNLKYSACQLLGIIAVGDPLAQKSLESVITKSDEEEALKELAAFMLRRIGGQVPQKP